MLPKDAVIATDSNGLITRMNPVAENLTGWKLSESLGLDLTRVFNIISADTGRKVENPVHTVLKTGQIVGLANHTVLIVRDGKKHQIADSGAPICNRDGNIIDVILVFRDVTEEYELTACAKSEDGCHRPARRRRST